MWSARAVLAVVALYARQRFPAALGALTGLTRSLFAFGQVVAAALAIPLFEVGGLLAPMIGLAAVVLLSAVLLGALYRAEAPPKRAGPPPPPTPVVEAAPAAALAADTVPDGLLESSVTIGMDMAKEPP